MALSYNEDGEVIRVPKILTIERATWRRGGGSVCLSDRLGPTRLLNDKGLMCCLGFDALACGIPREHILGQFDPESLLRGKYQPPQRDEDIPVEYINTRIVDFENAPAVVAAMSANDDSDISEEVREIRVRAALIQLGWDDVKFV
jgi:hypothetical protein